MTRTTITDEIIAQAEALAGAGYNNTQIAQTLELGASTLRNNKALKSVLLQARATLKEKVTKSVLANLEAKEINTTLILMKRYNLFGVDYKISRPKSPQQALQQITKINQDLASGSVPSDLAQQLIKNTLSYIKAFEAVEIHADILEIKEFIKQERAKNGK